MHPPTPSISEIKDWDENHVVEHLKKTVKGFNEKHATILINNEINGTAFLDCSKEELKDMGMAIGPIINITNEIARLKGGHESKRESTTSYPLVRPDSLISVATESSGNRDSLMTNITQAPHDAIRLSLSVIDGGYDVNVCRAGGSLQKSHIIHEADIQKLPSVDEYWEMPCRDLLKMLFPEGTPAAKELASANNLTTVLLDIPNDKMLTEVPWEFACSSDLTTTMLVLKHRFSRVVDRTFALEDLRELGQLHILVVAPDFYSDAVPLNPESEWTELVDAANSAQTSFKLELVSPPTLTELRSKLLHSKNAIFCYIGHGTKGSLLEFESNIGDAEPVPIDKLAEELRGRVRLALLSACNSHHAARSLAQMGIPFAIGAIRGIKDKVGRAFTKDFLEGLWHEKNITEAFSHACKEVQHVDPMHPENAGVMVLYSSQDDKNDDMRYYCSPGSVKISEPQWKENVTLRSSRGTDLRNRQKYLKILAEHMAGRYRLQTGERLVTILGPGGQGKTTLALMIAKMFRHKYSGGIFFHSFQTIPTLVEYINDLASCLAWEGWDERHQKEQALLMAAIQYLNKGDVVLLILDNAETLKLTGNLADAQTEKQRAKFRTFFEAVLQNVAKVKILATSREPLDWRDERVIFLDGMDEDEGAQVFMDSCHAKLKDDRIPYLHAVKIAKEISKKVAGHPLSLYLLGRSVNSDHMKFEDVISNLIDTLRKAADQQLGAGQRRHVTLMACFKDSIDRLTKPQLQLLFLVTLFDGPITEDVVQNLLPFVAFNIMSETRDNVTGNLRQLARRGTLMKPSSKSGVGHDEYAIHPAIRECTKNVALQQNINLRFVEDWQYMWCSASVASDNKTLFSLPLSIAYRYSIRQEPVGNRWFGTVPQAGKIRAVTIGCRPLWHNSINNILRLLKLSKLSEPPTCLCPIIDVFVDRSQNLYYVFEAPGQSLHHLLLDKNKSLKPDVGRDYMYQLIAAALFLQHQHIRLPFITPSSIFIAESGQIMIAPIGGVEQWHLMSECVGDNIYRICAPPEYFTGIEHGLTHHGVTWNLGCIFMEILTHEPLFIARDRDILSRDVFVKYLQDCSVLFRYSLKGGFSKYDNALQAKGLPKIHDILLESNKLFVAVAFENRFPKISGEGLSALFLLDAMLKLIPSDRISLEEALLHFCFRINHRRSDQLQYLLKDYVNVGVLYTPREVDVLMTALASSGDNIAILKDYVKANTASGSDKRDSISDITSSLEAKSKNDRWTLRHSFAAKDGDIKVMEVLMEIETDANLVDSGKRNMLHWVAIGCGNIEVMKWLANKYELKIDTKDAAGCTALHYSARNGNVDAIQWLLKKGADIHTKDEHGRTPLHFAAQDGHTDAAKLLLDQGADVNAKQENECTPLHYCAQGGHTGTAKVLIKHGAQVDAKTQLGWTPLHFAAFSDYTDTAQLLLEQGADANVRVKTEQTPLHYAAQYGHVNTVRLLLEKGANVNAKTKAERTPLHYAVQNGHTDTVKLLLKQGANIHAKQKEGGTPLHIVAQFGYTDTAKLLLEQGANVHAKTEIEWTPLHYAAQNGHTDTARLLLDKGADLHAKQNKGRTPLHTAAKSGHTDTVKLLLQQGSNINAETNYKSTALLLSAEYAPKIEVMRALLEYGAETKVWDNAGNSVLHCAALGKADVEVIRFLLENGADIATKNAEGKTVLDLVQEKDVVNVDVQKYLLERTTKVKGGWVGKLLSQRKSRK